MEWQNVIDNDERIQRSDDMVRIKCNVCKQYKTLKTETYENMLRVFGFKRSALFGMFHGIPSVFTGEPIMKTISKEETEKAFAGVYICQDCRNNKEETMKITRSLSRILNLENRGENNETKPAGKD